MRNGVLSTTNAGDYNYAVLTWVPIIGVKGSVTLASGTTLATTPLSATGIVTTGRGFPTSNVATLSGATPALTYVQSANGGMVAAFQEPLTITATNSYVLNIIFNPKGVLRGCSGNNSGNITDGTDSLTMPMLPVTAVLVASTDALMREAYQVVVNSTFSVEIDLYYLKSDSNKSVVAATVVDYPTNNTLECFGGDHRVFKLVVQADGSLNFYSGSDTSTLLLSGLQRNATTETVTFDTANYMGLPGSLTTGTVSSVTTTQY